MNQIDEQLSAVTEKVSGIARQHEELYRSAVATYATGETFDETDRLVEAMIFLRIDSARLRDDVEFEKCSREVIAANRDIQELNGTIAKADAEKQSIKDSFESIRTKYEEDVLAAKTEIERVEAFIGQVGHEIEHKQSVVERYRSVMDSILAKRNPAPASDAAPKYRDDISTFPQHVNPASVGF